MDFPEAGDVEIAIEPKTESDQEKLGARSAKLTVEDPTFRVRDRRGDRPDVISGMGELHLEILVDRLRREFGVDAASAARRWRTARRLTRRRSSEGRSSADRWSRAIRARQDLEPWSRRRRRHGFEFVDDIVGGAVPARVHQGGREGIREAMTDRRPGRLSDRGRQGHAVRRVVSTRSTRRRWPSRSPARWRSSEAARKAKPVLLEPHHGRRGRGPRSTWEMSSAT